MKAWKVILATVLIFGAGVITGGLIVGRLNHGPGLGLRPMRPAAVWPQPGPGFRLEFLRRAQRELELSAGQREKVEEILAESAARSRILMEPVAADLRGELDRARAQFRKVLTPQQCERFDQLMKERTREQRREKASRHNSEPETPREPPSAVGNP